MTLLQIFGGALFLCTLGAGACWLADDLIEAHVPRRYQPYVAAGVVGLFALVIALIASFALTHPGVTP